MFQFKFSYVALAAALTTTSVYADPTTYTHMSGTKVVDIEAPNAAGVSHNLYREFDVSNKGLILNNSPVDSSSSSVGSIAKNNNLINGSASVILNEVISNKASSLNGFIEVNGQKADVVIANPNGISCSGCSFINTNKAVLTTGKVNLSDTGAISSYNVTGGTINIGQNGMNAANSYAVLLADAIKINGTVSAQNAIISAGNFTFDNTTGAVTSAGKKASVMQMLIPEYSIDVSSLGGVNANSITMVGNNLGFGVRNKGAIVASRSLAMASNGTLKNEGTIAGNGVMTQLSSAGEMSNSGTISTKNMAALTSNGALNNTGTIDNNRQMVVSANGNIDNRGTLKSTNTLVVATNGNLSTGSGAYLQADEQLQINALGNIYNNGYTEAKRTVVNFGGSEMIVNNTLSGIESLQVRSSKDNKISDGAITNKGVISGGDVLIHTDGNLVLDKNSTTSATTSLTTHSYSLNNAGTLGGRDADLYLDNYVTTNSGNINGKSVDVWTYYDMLNEGVIRSYNDLEINTQNNGTITNRNLIQADGTMKLAGKEVINGGYGCGFLNLKTCGVGTLSANKLELNTKQKYASNMGGKQYFKSTEINTVN